MGDNRRKHANGIAVGSVAKWAMIAFFVGAIGLSYVCLKNQIHATSKQIRKLEEDFEDLKEKDLALSGRVAMFRSRDAVSGKLKEHGIKMIPIPHDRIVQLPSAPRRLVSNEIRAVANQGDDK